jgi:glyoxylase-like metal-dependent hydrolase (beta-lactamase superfamily II)
MKARISFAFLALAALAACTQTPPEQQLLNDAAQAMGGAERVQTVTALVLEGEGTQYNLGQDLKPEASGETFAVTEYKRSIDVAQGRARTELTRRPNFQFFQGPAPQRQVQGIDGPVGYDIAPTGAANRIPEAAASDRRAELYHHPLIAVRAALDAAAQRANLRTEGNETLIDVTAANGQAYTLAVDTMTKLPTRVVTRTDNTNLGDVVLETRFDGYGDASGFQLPSRLTTKIDDFTTAEVRLTQQTVNGMLDDLAAPADAANSPAVAAPPPANVTVEELSKGIWYLAGQSHHSVLVEFSDHALLIEAPQNDTRALAVIAKARELLPGKPLTQLVNSHHHFDHSGGVRAAISEGLTVITHQDNAAFFERVAARPHTIVPDALARNPQPLKLEPVSDEKTLSDGSMALTLYPVTSEHSETMLVAYFPKERLLVEADLYTPGRAVSPYAAKFLEDLKARKLQIDHIVPLHGAVVPFAQFEKDAIAAAAAN